jgi:hypothetical protein
MREIPDTLPPRQFRPVGGIRRMKAAVRPFKGEQTRGTPRPHGPARYRSPASLSKQPSRLS